MVTEKANILKEAFLRQLDIEHQKYDQNENMLVNKQSGRGYHSSLAYNTVHEVRGSMEYAAALLYTGNPDYRERAAAVINKILSLQDRDTNSNTYGIWPYFLEEPLGKMKAPDWNWADFIGRVLVHLLADHRTALSDGTIKDVENALYHAAASIVRRNIGPDYTNINLMGAFVTIKAGELLNNDSLFHYGKKRLKKEVEFVRANGGFSEYNSPTYTIVALEEIGRMLKYFIDKECLEEAAELNDIEWRCIAHHYHPATKQLSAPHSRCYANISGKSLLSFIHIGTEMKLDLIDSSELQVGLLWNHMVVKCPEKYYGYFEPITEPRLFKEEFYKGRDIISDDEIRVLIEKGTPRLEATTYMNQAFTLGTFARYDLWNQRRPLMAYWGTADECTYLKLRCLHDDHDYCSAMICSTQVENHVVGGVYFVKDHGDFHFILDPLIDGKIRAKKLSLRFELGGYIDDVAIPDILSIGSAFEIKTSRVNIGIDPMFCAFGSENVKITSGRDESTCWVELSLYEGEEKEFDFNSIGNTAFVFGLSIFDKEDTADKGVSFRYDIDSVGKTVKGELVGANEPASIEIPLNPSEYIAGAAAGRTKKVKCGGFVYL